MILPIRTNIQPSRTPYCNYALIAINTFIFLFTYTFPSVSGYDGPVWPWARTFMLISARPYLWQFISYAFLHSSLMHLFGNMYFLYIFGNNVNDKLGTVNYLSLYFGGAIFAGIGHAVFNINPVLGASGAVAAITGAYMVLFPQTVITVIYWLFFIGTTEISALYLIAFKMIVWDNILGPNFSNASIAYGAHLAGYAFGIIVMLFMLAAGLLGHSQFDLWAMIRRWNMRRQYRDVVTSHGNPFTVDRFKRKNVKATEVKNSPQQAARQDKITQLRDQIFNRIAQANLAEAAGLYLDLMEIDETQVISRQNLLDIANQLMAMGKWSQSAQAYEKFLNHYKNYQYSEQVQLMLGLLYSRYLDTPAEAIKYLEAARGKLTEPGQIKMCSEELAKLQG